MVQDTQKSNPLLQKGASFFYCFPGQLMGITQI